MSTTGHPPTLPVPLSDPLPATGRRPPATARRKRAARAAAWFVGFVLVTHGGFLLLLDYGPPRLRDPEYGHREARAHARRADHPGRPLVLAVGSSRTAMGVRPGVLEVSPGEPGRPLLVNYALAGSGPVMELMAFRRAWADGLRPAAVLVEFWPAFMREDGQYLEEARIDVSRLRPVDRQLVREYFADPDRTFAAMRRQRLNPWYGHRRSLANQLCPGWIPYRDRNEAMWANLDDWGWLPGRDPGTDDDRARSRAGAAGYYAPLFQQGYDVAPLADRAFRQLVRECQEKGVRVALLYLPEAEAFRDLMPEDAKRKAAAYLAAVTADLGVPLIDARTGWVPDDDLVDGFHLTKPGAAAFTRKLGPAVAATFPDLRPAPP